MNEESKAAVTVAQMARMCSLSRSRFYQLIGSAFPEPSRDDRGRPFYDAEQQAICLEVRRRNYGIDGRPILFYAPRHCSPVAKRKPKPKTNSTSRYPEIVDGVRALGLTTVTAAEVEAVVKRLFPSGTDGVDPGEVIRSVFLSIKRRDRPDNVTR
jgi:hypothetical protein